MMRFTVFSFFFLLHVFALRGQQVQGTVTGCTGHEPVREAVVRILGSDNSAVEVKTDSLGRYSASLKNGNEYIVLVLAPPDNGRYGFSQTHYYNLYDKEKKRISTKSDSVKNFTADFCLQSGVSCGFAFPSPFFAHNSAVPMPDTAFVYGREDKTFEFMVHLLEDNPTIVIELGGHADSSETKPIRLSLKRAQSLADSLVKRGIAADRLLVKEYGAVRPRRLPDGTILSQTYLKSLPAKEREAMRDLNRRVVIRIMSWDYKAKKGG